MDFTKDSDVFIANGELISDVVLIQECLEDIQKWVAAVDPPGFNIQNPVGDALHDVHSLYRRLIDLQIELLTLA